MENNSELTILGLAPLIRRKRISPVELTKFFLERIDRLQPAINAYATVTPEIALAQARQAEREIMKGRYRGVLHGIPINFKDLFFTDGVRTTAGSAVLKNFVPDENAEVVSRLLNSGCILLGKTNMHEFAFGSTSVHSCFGPVRNPWDTSRISGGSSGGSAASIVSAQAVASFGTDTGGSVRIPAAACGCVGFKPTYGRVSLKGVIPLASSLDHAGPLSRCVLDAAFLLSAVDRQTPFPDIRHLIRQVRSGVKSLKVGIPRHYFFDHLQTDVRRSVLAAVQVLEDLGATVCEVDIKGMRETARIAAEITGSEALAFHELWLQTKSREYGADVRSRLEQSRGVPATVYIKALQIRSAYSREYDRVLENVDLLAGPTLPTAAPRIEEKEIVLGRSREEVRTALLRLTRPGNLTGLPAISIPCGLTRERLPVGLQLIGRRFHDHTALQAAYAYEQATPWHRQFPDQPDPELPGASTGTPRN